MPLVVFSRRFMAKKPRSRKPQSSAPATARPAATTALAASSPLGVPTPDERNLVAVDEAFAEASFEDRLWLWWQRNGQAVLLAVVAVVVVAALWQVVMFFQRQAERGVQAEYREATASPEALATFQKRHAKHPLGGLAALTLADQAFSAGDFGAAAAGYRSASGPLAGLPLAGRAQLGQAMSLALQGGEQRVIGAALLDQMAGNAGLLTALREEAAFHRMALALEDGQMGAARRAFEQLELIDAERRTSAAAESASFINPWMQFAEQLSRTFPALKAPIAMIESPTVTGGAPSSEAAVRTEEPDALQKLLAEGLSEMDGAGNGAAVAGVEEMVDSAEAASDETAVTGEALPSMEGVEAALSPDVEAAPSAEPVGSDDLPAEPEAGAVNQPEVED